MKTGMAENRDPRQVIIVAAKGLFARFGLGKTTMEDIARASNKAKSTLYYYFKSKEDVFTSVIMLEIAGLKAAIGQAVRSEDDPGDRFRVFVETRLKYFSKKTDQYISIREDYHKHHGLINDLLDDYSQWEIATIKRILEYGSAKGVFDVHDFVGVSRGLFLALKGLEYPWVVDISKNELEKSTAILLDILLKGVSRN
ncbi:TetR/AcrR family transcriptional regulator [Desulfoluna sp.]|uniref:TetR/AcrR family transcriptional regulator n=1 Tax=Desulfoluna sp. TaxID=2045199 RepID=UPI0026295734|nr:TetR/AcrR family transcriptional regulator [Desulfoluna sp.]